MKMIDMMKKIKNKQYFFLSIILVSLYIFYKMGNKYLPVENLALCSGIGCDIINQDEDISYKISVSIYNIEGDNKIYNEILTAIDKSIPETREIRQTKLDRKFIFGLEKVLLCSDAFAESGISNLIDSLFHHKDVNDTAYMIVCSGNAEDILKFQIQGYYSSSDYIKGIIERSSEFNFYSNNYKFIDAYVRVASEGRNFVTPHIAIKDNMLQMDGTAVFNKDKMVTKLNIKESKIMNLMRENNGMGILTLQYTPSSYINFYGVSKHTTECSKTEEGYNFKITVMLDGEVVSNTTSENLVIHSENLSDIQKKFEIETKKQCEEFISKMQNDFKTDCLELGNIAAAKYGRNQGIDWNKEVLKSKIDVDVKVKISGTGRGDF